MREEVLVPFETPARPSATAVRSTLVCSSLKAIRSRGLFDRYWRAVADAHKPAIEAAVPGQWLPIDVGVAHYQACDALPLDHDQRIEIGAEVGRRVNQTVLSVVMKMSREAGVTPWSGLARVHKLRDVTWQGSDVAVWKLGPKDARFVWIAQPCAASTHFVYGMVGFLGGLIELFCQKAYVRLVTQKRTPTSFELRASWV